MVMTSKKWWAIGAAAVVALLLAAVAGVSGYFGGKALPGTAIAGVSIGGMTQDEAAAQLEQRASEAVLTIDAKGNAHAASLADLGRTVDVQATIDQAYAPSATFWTRITHLMHGSDTEPVVSADPVKLQTYTASLLEGVGTPAQDASVAFDEESGTFTVAAAVPGEKVDEAPIAAAADTVGKTLQPASLTADIAESDPVFTTELAQGVADKANGIIGQEVTLGDGISDYVASAAEKAQWVKIASVATGQGAAASGDAGQSGAASAGDDQKAVLDATIDEGKIGEWVDARANDFNEPAVNGKRNVNDAGEVVSIAHEGTPGYTVNNADKVKADVIAGVKGGQGYQGSFDFDRTPEPTWEDRKIAPGSENLAYQAAEGEKWIDINLTNATVQAFVGAEAANNPMPMVPGAPDTPTVTGTFQIYLKYPSQDMGGAGWDYFTPGVPSVMYFHGSYALHGAYWRDSFGWSGPGGSHGCVNMPLGDAAWLYDWAPMGTTVVSHY